MDKNVNFLEIIDIVYLTPENAKFELSKNGFVMLEAFLPPVKKDDLEETEESKEPVWQKLGRVFFHRAFPFTLQDEYISVLDKDGKEYGIIRDINLFEGEMREIIQNELKRKYFTPIIKKIKSLKERFGYAYLEVESDCGDLSFAVHDASRNLVKITENRIIINDVDGNRYEIPDVYALDRKSFRKINFYL